MTDCVIEHPLLSVPTLDVDGVRYCESAAILRYVGSLGNPRLYPSNPLDQLKCDEAIEVLTGLMSNAPKSADAEEKKRLREAYEKNDMTLKYGLLEKRLSTSSSGWIAGGSISIADILLLIQNSSIEKGDWDYINKDFFSAYPHIRANMKKTREHEKVAQFYAGKL